MADIEPDDDLVQSRAELLPEEIAVGSDDPQAQARILLEDSEQRTAHPEQAREESSQTPDA
jgi:hypothetical protein